MDDVKIPQESVPLWVSLFLAVVVTLNVLLHVLIHWHDLGMLQRLISAVLLGNLVVMPVVFVRAQRREKPLGGTQLLTFAYGSVMLATLLFEVRS
jgi:hypothetical protein